MKLYVAAPLMALALVLPQVAHAERPASPQVPNAIQVPKGYKPFLAGHAIGTQGYVCIADQSAYGWSFFGPQATLFDENSQQILTHFLSPTPYNMGLNPTWLHSADSSAAWGQAVASSSDPRFVAADAIPWLLLEALVVGDGPTFGETLLRTRYIQRVNTIGGIAPLDGCTGPGDVKKRALVPYEADYFFYERVELPRDK